LLVVDDQGTDLEHHWLGAKALSLKLFPQLLEGVVNGAPMVGGRYPILAFARGWMIEVYADQIVFQIFESANRITLDYLTPPLYQMGFFIEANRWLK